jgi:hypothetical protein
LMELQMTQMNTLMQTIGQQAATASALAALAAAPAVFGTTVHTVDAAAAPMVAAAVAAANIGLLAAEAKLAVNKKLPDELVKHFKNTARDFERRTTKYLNVNMLRQTLKEKCAVFAGNNPAQGFKYPNGVRAWHVPVEVDSIDEPWSCVVEREHTCEIVIPKGTSRRDAMQRIHHTCQGFLMDLHHETVAAHAEVLRETVAKEEFVRACGDWKPEKPGVEDGLDAPLRRLVDSEEARVQVELLYGKVVDDARMERDKKDKEILARAEVEKKKLEEAAKLPPQKTLVGLIDERIAAKVKNEDDFDEDMETNEKADEKALKSAEEFCAGLKSGNGRAPKVGKGSAVKAQPPASTRTAGKGGAKNGSKQQQKRKGTGKVQSPAKGKGKGKGKEKGKGKGQQQYHDKGYGKKGKSKGQGRPW